MALPPSFSLHDFSLISGIEPLPLSSPTSPHKVLSHSSSPPPVLPLSSTSSIRRATSSGVTANLYASLRLSRDLDREKSEAGDQDSGTEEHFGDQGATMSETEDLAEEMSQRLQEGVEASGSKGVSPYISQMECLRNHLQNMLSLSKTVTTHNGLTEKREEEQSDNTSTLLNAHPIKDFSPPLSMSGLECLFPRYASLYNSAPPLPDLQMRDALERETTRRKHLERHVQNLQNEMLELQQRLTVTLTADRRKDTMIQQLDQTLAVVVGGWKQQEQHREEVLLQLKAEKEDAVQARDRDKEIQTRAQHELSEVLEALSREKQTVTEKERDIKNLVEEKMTLSAQLQEEREMGKEAKEQEHREMEALQYKMQEQQKEWEERLRELQEECDRIVEEKRREVESERSLAQQETQKSQQWQLTASSLQGEVQRLERDLQISHRERDSLQMELNLEKARSESERVRIESEHKMHLEEAITERLSAVHEENSKHLSAVREQHRKQLLNLTSQHETELSAQLYQFKSELQERERRHRDVTMEYELKLSHTEQLVQELSLALRRLEGERAEMVTQLQGVMQSHWSQALRVLGSKGLPDGSNSEDKWTECHKRDTSKKVEGGLESQNKGGDSKITNCSNEVREFFSQPLTDGRQLKSINSQLMKSGSTNNQQGFNSDITESVSPHNNSQQRIQCCPLEDRQNQCVTTINGSSHQPVGSNHFKDDHGSHIFRLNQLMESSNQNTVDHSHFRETSRQSVVDSLHNSSHIIMDNKISSQQMIGSDHKNGNSQSMKHKSPLMVTNNKDNVVSSNFKETSSQSSLNREANRQHFSENNRFKDTSSISMIGVSHSANQHFVDQDTNSQNISGIGQLSKGGSYINSQKDNVTDPNIHNIIDDSHLKESRWQSVIDEGQYKEVTNKLIGVSRQKDITSNIPPQAVPQPRALSCETRSHSGYQAETRSPRATNSEESFYPLQMEDLSHSFSSHQGFYSLAPYPDETTIERASGLLYQESPEHPFQEESLIFGNNSLTSPPSVGSSGEKSTSNSLLQYYIRMLLDRTPGDPLNEEQEKDTSRSGPVSLPTPGVSDISRFLAAYPTTDLNELREYLSNGSIQLPPRLDQNITKTQAIPPKNTDTKAPDAVKKEVVSSQRRPLQKVLKRVSTRGGRPGIWR
ncbi:centrobin isoform 2-T2 [Discoglossus pictus]